MSTSASDVAGWSSSSMASANKSKKCPADHGQKPNRLKAIFTEAHRGAPLLLSRGLKAEELDQDSHKMNDSSEHALHPLHKLEQALTLIQIAIAMGSITALTRKRWLFMIALVAAGGGITLFGIALAT